MNCIICQSMSVPIEDAHLKKTFFHCPNCQAIFLDPQYYLDAQTEMSKYKLHNNSIENVGYVKMFEEFIDFFWQHLPATEALKTLEFGCGPGPVLATLLERKGLDVCKYDPFFYPEPIGLGQKFSLITSTEVFEHLQKPMDVLANLVGHLKDDGILAVMTHFHYNNIERFLQWWYRRDPTHIVFYNPTTFAYMAKKLGLKILGDDNKRIIVFKLA